MHKFVKVLHIYEGGSSARMLNVSQLVDTFETDELNIGFCFDSVEDYFASDVKAKDFYVLFGRFLAVDNTDPILDLTQEFKHCNYCGDPYFIKNRNKSAKYCNDACKQKAYRDRKDDEKDK